MKNSRFDRRLRFALAGIAVVWRRERSFRTQATCAAGTIVWLAVWQPGAL